MENYQQPNHQNNRSIAYILVLILCLSGVIGGFFAFNHFTAKKTITEDVVGEDRDVYYITSDAIDRLGACDLSLARIQEIEAHCLHDGSQDEEDELNARIIALKHIYVELFLTEEHSVKRLHDIYALHGGELSKEQQQVFKDFFALSDGKQLLLEIMNERVENFDDFTAKMKQIIINNQNTNNNEKY